MEHILHERPVAVSAVGQGHLSAQVIDVAYLSVHYDSPLLAHFHCSWLAPVKIRRTLIVDEMRVRQRLRLLPSGRNGMAVVGSMLDHRHAEGNRPDLGMDQRNRQRSGVPRRVWARR
jgi:hypothetical protein